MANLVNICRACLKETDKYYPLFENYANDITLASILNRFTHNKITQNDNLSSTICESCARILVQFSNFLLIYETSTKTLTSIQNELDSQPHSLESNETLHNESVTFKQLNLESFAESIVPTNSINSETIKEPVVKKNFVCDVCGKKCRKKSDLKDHLETHGAELKYSCEICEKRLKCRTSLLGHMRAHKKPNQYMCELCGKKFTQMSTLRTHRLQLHVSEKKFHCVICERRFSLKSSLKKHVERHRNREGDVARMFKCLQCDMKYLDKSSLSRHIDVKHTKTSIYQCEICDASFSTSRNLLRHRNVIHVNE